MEPNYWHGANWIGSYVKYRGNRRPYLNGQTFKVVQQNTQGTSVAFYNSDDTLEWCAKTSLEMVANPELMDIPHDCSRGIDQVFIAASGGVEENIVNEISRLEKRIAELKSALTVIRSL